jgi:hypothetical protein
LSRCGKAALSIGEFLTGGLKPPFQLGDFPVAGGQVVRCPGKLRLQIVPLLGHLALDLGLLPSEALALGLQSGELRLAGFLGLSHLLEASLGLSQLR